ncbi:MAG TPA: tetratricopeptide repeat protein [Burkholderiales bacterium]|nr:tetratricopeptide repeat protein [Burkholderiales bacterium]
MAVYDLQEQEQIDALKAWWKQHQRLVLLAVAAAILTFGGISGWRYYQSRQALAAGELYSQMETALNSGDKSKARDIAAALTAEYPATGYAMLAALVGARVAVDSGDAAGAQAQLQWLTDHAGDDATRDLARLRLAALLLDEKKYPDALALLETRHGAAWDALYDNLKGDVLVAQGRTGEARAAYQAAFDKSAAQNAFRALVQTKIDALGGTR